jgi:hypothetical protein
LSKANSTVSENCDNYFVICKLKKSVLQRESIFECLLLYESIFLKY